VSNPSRPQTPANAHAAVGVAPAGPASTLSRELADFLIELSIALHKHAIYPAGHPLLTAAVDKVTRNLWALLQERPVLSIGIARRQLIIEGVATDPNHPLLQELASKLHKHHLGAVKFSSGIDREELRDALATVAVDAGRIERPLGLDSEEVSGRWQHVRLFPLTYDKLELLDEKPSDDAKDNEGQMKSGRAAQLWVGMARAALAADSTGSDTEKALEPTTVAKAIDEHSREVAYDQVIVGYMLQIADELKAAKGAEGAALQKRISKMLGSLQPETLQRLLEMGGDTNQRRKFVLDASQGMTVDAVVELVKAAATAEKQTISHSLVRLFSKLAKHADDSSDKTRRMLADNSLRENVVRLLNEWSLDDPNPGAYGAVLEEISRSAPVGTNRAGISLVCEPERIVQMGLEVGVLGPRVEHAIDMMLKQHALPRLLDILDMAPDPALVDGVWGHLEAADTLRTVLAEPRIDFPLTERIVKRMRLAAIQPLLDALEVADETKTRERMMDLLATIGDDVGPYIVERLPSARAALQREFLVALGRLSALPQGFDPREYLRHPEPVVRREAVRLMLKDPATRDQTLISALSDPDDRTVFLALTAAAEHCPPAAVSVIRGRVDRGELDASLRALGIRAVAGTRSSEMLPWLLTRVVARTKWLRRRKLANKTPEMMAALGALAAYWKTDERAKDVIAMAEKSRDPDVRQATTSSARISTAIRVTPS
jgi:hypothetical protein